MSKFKALVWCCEHHPYMSQKAQARILRLVRETQGLTHLIRLGDVFEAAAASRHSDEHEHTLNDEYEAAGRFTANLNEAAPKLRKVWTLGNHDDNLQAKDARRIPKTLRDLSHWNAHAKWGSAFREWQQIPYVKAREGIFRLGNVLFFHGFDAGSNSDETEGLQAAYLCGGHGNLLSVRGHTHRPLPPTPARKSRTVPLSHHYMNVGTVGPLKPNYARRLSTIEWGFGAAIIEGSTRPSLSRNWSAQLLQ